jgi:excisionase family DNA binding protein
MAEPGFAVEAPRRSDLASGEVTAVDVLGDCRGAGRLLPSRKDQAMSVADRVIDVRARLPQAPGGDRPDVVRPAVWLSGQEAAEHVGVSWPTLRQLLVDQGIPHVRLGRRWKIEVAVLDDHLRQLANSTAFAR